MGYRSEVHIAVPKRDEAELDAIMNRLDLLESEHECGDNRFYKMNYTQRWQEISNGVTTDKSRDVIIYQALSLKWYEQYKDVQEINSFIKMGEEDGRCIVCVGEDNAVHSDIGDYGDVFNIYMKVELT
jgi:hypothetical protein